MTKYINDKYIDYFLSGLSTKAFILTSDFKFLRKTRHGYVQMGSIHHKNSSNTSYYHLKYKNTTIMAHRVLYKYYYGYIDSNLSINHIDGDGLNNTKANLELTTDSAQMLHKYRVLKYPPVKGHKKISQTIADNIRLDYSTGKYSYKDLCLKYKLCKSSVSYIINNKTWK